ncbi:hypothetical protein [Costertonia aggregata]|uniref:Uncharacterized protein n=1 Tax=Costertonia aggregata TaxID=343403 RepID=A0A7H9APG0_9FLAO|nr:hypothetical protein [Costertonia aggregata]QLG45310.1 hypothetical protein HYG79_08100 [Costertonia aggregata]
MSGIENTFVNIYQKDEFDFVTPLYYEILDSDENLILEKHHLIGTNDQIMDLENFKAKSYDSIVYLTWGKESEIYAVCDLKSGKGYPKSKLNKNWKTEFENSNDLVNRLKEINPDLKANWNN